MRKKLILVAGVSGVGKSTLCSKYAKNNNSTSHVQASKFAELVDGEDQDQAGLAKKIREEFIKSRKEVFLLDGHLIIGGKKIPEEAINILSPDGIIIVTDNPEKIYFRKINDNSRKRSVSSPVEIAEEQNSVVEYAKKISTERNKPLQVIEEASSRSLSEALDFMTPH
ncbi:AAA family ATPase [Onishia niordana]|uniref:AAA family ATPase n=1 Tax=Onishia niordana TaxID=2508711 RepID=UPI001447ECCD|nr:AAA family ATPase [Halomonas niordiana]